MIKNRIKTIILSGVVALSALSAPLSPAVLTSPSLSVSAADNDNYAKLLQYSLYLYDANMCGTQVSENSNLTWRGDCHTSDEIDGGYHDAGDHAMFGLPQGFTASTLGWGYYEFKDAYDATGQTAHFKTISDHFTDFFKASTKLDGSGNVTSFLYQKGDGNEDHAYWGAPENQGGNRKMFWTSSGASDIAAEYAAALAISYLNFGDSSDLKYAEALYAFSTRYNQVATDGPAGFYGSTGCNDEQAWAAGWLYLATKKEQYKNDCASKQQQYLGWVHGWDNTGLGAACVYAYITGDWGKVNSYLGQQCSSSNYLFMDKWGSARLNTTMQFCALVATKHSNADYTSWAKGQMNYILGANPVNTCFVVGYASNSAKNPHHRAASGYNSYDEMGDSKVSSPNGHSLIGALVGGPSDAGGTYADDITDYVCNEVAIDYNAGFVGAAAGLYSFYKTGSTESSIVGVKNVSSPSVTTTTTKSPTVTTTTTTTKSPTVTTTTTTKATGSGKYTYSPNQRVVYDNNSTDKMVGWEWAEFGIPATEKVTKVEVKIKSNNGNIGKWQGAFGSSTKVDPDYWTQSTDMEQSIASTSGTITWNVPTATADIIQYNYGGEIKFGTWWVDCQDFTVESITVYTNGTATTTTTTKAPVVTTTTTTKAPVVTTTTTTKAPVVTTTTTTPNLTVKLAGDANCDNTVDMSDAVLIMQSIANPDKYGINGSVASRITAQGKVNGDVYQPGSDITSNDALSIQKFRLNLIKSLPET